MKQLNPIYWLLPLSICTAVAAQSPLVPMYQGPHQYRTWFEEFGVTVQALERGYPRAVPVKPDGSAADGEKPPEKIPATMQEAFDTNIRETAKRRDERLAGKMPSSVSAPAPAPTIPDPAPVPVEAFSAASWKAFCGCVKKTIPALRLKLRLASVDETLTSYEIEAALAEGRGNGKRVEANGMACGRHLGQYGAPSPGTNTEIQWLAVFERATDSSEVTRLWSHFLRVSAMMRGEPLKAPEFWEFAWRKLAFRSVMTTRKPPELKTLIDDYVEWTRGETKIGKRNLVIQAKRADVEAAVLEDWNDKKFSQGVTPCEAK